MSDPIRTAEAFLDALLAHDDTALQACLHPRVHLRALQNGTALARVGAVPVGGHWARLLGSGSGIEVLDRSAWRCAGRAGLGFRFAVGDPLDRHECEQHMYLDLQDGLVHRIDVLSSGVQRSGHRHGGETR